MRNALLSLALVLSTSTWAQAPASSPNKAEVEKRVKTFFDALTAGDVKTLETIYADGYMFLDPDGTIQTRKERLGAVEKTGKSLSHEVQHLALHDRGSVVLATGEYHWRRAGDSGQPVERGASFLQTWIKVGGTWKMISSAGVNLR